MGENSVCRCIICEQQKPIHEGIHIVSEFICGSCEAEMVRTDVKDDKYPFYVHQLKQIWMQNNA
ncbi:sigma factor G inhibitor Gin [Paenibacillus beijingensis]|uniref:Inhibitor of sigma-G Gin n=1 Tax=Paenibacillus beijingensis TaxID=1126833 RepID=A0A0D5NIF3_9BACL|nr:sigma factor G inhibitor Gin [Paenibacillus beijingensis]AJY74900.1 inhibitor of sigma-G Gin [Paenibacillus beijingensis]